MVVHPEHHNKRIQEKVQDKTVDAHKPHLRYCNLCTGPNLNVQRSILLGAEGTEIIFFLQKLLYLHPHTNYGDVLVLTSD